MHRKDKTHWPNQVRRCAQHDIAFAQCTADAKRPTALQIDEIAVDQMRESPFRTAASEIMLLEESDAQTSRPAVSRAMATPFNPPPMIATSKSVMTAMISDESHRKSSHRNFMTFTAENDRFSRSFVLQQPRDRSIRRSLESGPACRGNSPAPGRRLRPTGS